MALFMYYPQLLIRFKEFVFQYWKKKIRLTISLHWFVIHFSLLILRLYWLVNKESFYETLEISIEATLREFHVSKHNRIVDLSFICLF